MLPRKVQQRIPALRVDPEEWERFVSVASSYGWTGSGAMRELIIQFSKAPFDLPSDKGPVGSYRTGWFFCDQAAVQVLDQYAKKAGISQASAIRHLLPTLTQGPL